MKKHCWRHFWGYTSLLFLKCTKRVFSVDYVLGGWQFGFVANVVGRINKAINTGPGWY